jgi:glutamate decarboxylase
VQELVELFFEAAQNDVDSLESSNVLQTGSTPHHGLTRKDLRSDLSLSLPQTGLGHADLVSSTASILDHSVNASSPAFMDKLWSAPSIPGIAADLLLSSLNGNAHVFRVSPALTSVEKHVGKELAKLFGFDGPNAGGITFPGGAASNTTALLVARNVRFPELKNSGLIAAPGPLAVFVSEASHYSVITAAGLLGIGLASVRKIRTTEAGTMDPIALKAELQAAVDAGHIPLFVCATAGTTVRGAYDPLNEIGQLAHEYGAWFHIDGCFGGAAIFSEKLKYKLDGSELADSIAFNPHKLLGVPQICSFLLAKDLKTLWVANRLEAGYLFHDDELEVNLDNVDHHNLTSNGTNGFNGNGHVDSTNANWRSSGALLEAPDPNQVYDLASFTPQCGRRPDSLKLYFHWRYYGTEGIAKQVEAAYEGAQYLSKLIAASPNLYLVGKNYEVPCTQVCFYYMRTSNGNETGELDEAKKNSYYTRLIISGLEKKGWMVDFAPGSGRYGEKGHFVRIVCNRSTTPAVCHGLMKAISEITTGIENFV